jgi:hypothetical protein
MHTLNDWLADDSFRDSIVPLLGDVLPHLQGYLRLHAPHETDEMVEAELKAETRKVRGGGGGEGERRRRKKRKGGKMWLGRECFVLFSLFSIILTNKQKPINQSINQSF